VRNALTGEVGLRLLDLAVPDFGAGPLLLPPVFPNPAAGSWVAALSKTARTSPALLADGGLPAAQPVLGIDREARFEAPAWKVSPEALRVEVLRPDGVRAAELPARIVARREAAGLEWLTVSFVPAGLETGRYLLRTDIPGTAAPAWASPFVLLPGGGGGKVWAELMHEPQSPPREAGRPEPAHPRRRTLDAGPIREAYRQALELLAHGEEPGARSAVAALEAPLLTGPAPAAPEDVAEIELGVVRDLAAAHPPIVLPIALLHESLYREAQQHHDFVLAAHTRELVFELAGLAAEHGDDTGRHTAARLLLGLASHLAESAPATLRDRIFRQVLAYDKDEPAAHLYLAAEAEREGRYPDAVSHLEGLLRTHPEDAEARLRLAVNLRRLGKPREADRLLEELARAPAEPWVLACAYEETGRALIAAGRLDEAERFLRDGLERLPGDEKLLFELASVFDLRSDPAQARQILAAFRPASESAESARHRYNRVPSDALDRAWNDLVRSAPESLAALADALRPQHPAPPRRGAP
jgi:Flp pilus assembly protein TadD